MRIISLAFLVAVTASCPERDFPRGGDPPRSDVVEVDATFCARPADDVAFPVKVLIAMDTSSSWQTTDPQAKRFDAVRAFVADAATKPNVFVATMGFGSNVYVEPTVTSSSDARFVPAAAWTEPAFFSFSDDGRDLDQALSAMHDLLLGDMLRSDPNELGRTRYVVVVVSDGSPAPLCCTSADATVGAFGNDAFGCALESFEIADASTTYCENSPEPALCTDDNALSSFRVAAPTTNVPDVGNGVLVPAGGYVVGNDYNRSSTLHDLASDIAKLGDDFGVPVSLDAELLYDDADKASLDLNRCRAEKLFGDIANQGRGLFHEDTDAANLDLVATFDTESQPHAFTFLSMFVRNANALPGGVTDTDGDGIADDVDATPTLDDANRDGLRDSIAGSFCPEASLDAIDRSDLDGDGLNGCEEHILGTDPKSADSDRDGIPDDIEIAFGLDPTTPNSENQDSDFDGTPDVIEVRAGTDPAAPSKTHGDDATRYRIDVGADGCASFEAGNVVLAKTIGGVNHLELVVEEQPIGNLKAQPLVRVACADVTRVDGSAPPPVTFTSADFVDPIATTTCKP